MIKELLSVNIRMKFNQGIDIVFLNYNTNKRILLVYCFLKLLLSDISMNILFAILNSLEYQ